MRVEVSAKAYTTLLLHALKYPHAAVNGLLVGGARAGGGALRRQRDEGGGILPRQRAPRRQRARRRGACSGRHSDLGVRWRSSAAGGQRGAGRVAGAGRGGQGGGAALLAR